MKIGARFVLWCSLAVVCAFLAGTAEAAYIYDYELTYIYWSDATHTPPSVGVKVRDCCGGIHRWGVWSPYMTMEQGPCTTCFDPCYGPECKFQQMRNNLPDTNEKSEPAHVTAHDKACADI